ncbi:unnamed protein product [Calicophoron daubneyi]|uniref:Ig-like domain-containing protein n=1 Tax=Calicophoron daubneyi TaxID=300641 RepID=A0AAV2TG66_CALDB
MSDRASSTESSDFSDGYPTTTTISTVAVQAGDARIVLAVLRCGNWIRVRIQRMEPDLYDIGANAAEAQALHEVHNHLCEKLAAKQEQISQLLSRADDLVTQQTSESQTQVYAAMAESLNRAWRDLLGVLSQRGHLLELSLEFYTSADDMIAQAENVEHLCNQAGWGHNVQSIRHLIEEHAQLKRTGLLEPTHRMLSAANSLLELLARLSNQSGPSASYSSSTGAGRASVEAREHIASITAKAGAKRRHAEAVWNRRERLLNLRLAVVSMEAELDNIIEWFIKDGEPRLSAAQLGTCLSDCQVSLDTLMTLAEEVRDVQSRHTRLMRNLQQASTTEDWHGLRTKSVFDTLDADQQELEMELRRNFGEYEPMEVDATADVTRTLSEEAWQQTHGTYSELANRMRITEAYIWEFLDRIEQKRRLLNTGLIYYSEINVLLTQIYQLEAEMKEKQGISLPGQEDAFFDRLNDLDMRVPGLQQTLAEIRAGCEETGTKSTLRTQLGLTTMPAVPRSVQSSASISAATDKLREVEDGIARCRSLFTVYQEKSVKAQRRREVEGRVDILRAWLSQRIQKSLVEHANMGTTPELVADFEDFHRRLERELSSREPELDDLRKTVTRLSPSPEKSSLETISITPLQVRLTELQSEWTKCHQTITIRLRLAENYHSLLKRVREDEYQQNIVLERMHQLDGTDPTIVGPEIRPGSLAGLVGIEGPENLRNEVTVAIDRLEEQQARLRDSIDQITQQADRDLSTAEPLHYCQLQIELNTKRLTQLRESWISCERFWDQWKMTREYWAKFTEAANQLDEVMTSSLSRMTRTPLPTTAIECDRAIREHLVERENVDQLSTTVKSRAQQLGNLVGCRPDDLTESGMGWRFVEVPVGIKAGMPGSSTGRRVRSEMSLRLAGLETRWTAWDRAWATHKIHLERRGVQVGRLATIEEVETEVANAERNLQTIFSSVSLKAPLEQVEKADRDLSQLEAAIPVLETRVLSTAAGPKMQLLQGAPEEMDVSELPIDVTSRQEQLDRRVHYLADAASKCRVEVNITLRLLRAMKVAENSLTQITFNLNEVQQKLHTLPLDDREGIEMVRKEMETELIRGQAVADTQIPALEKLAAEHPKPIEAEHHIQPVVSGFRSAISELRRVTEEVRVRSERSIKLTPAPGIPVPEDKMTQQFIAPPALPYRPEAPIITKPLQNVYADEGTSVIMEVEFQSNLPPDANPYDQNQLQATWFKDGVLLQTPDYESRLTPTEAGLRIGETLGEDTGQFTCRISTPYGQAETSGKLTVNVPVSPSSAQRPVEEAAIQPCTQFRERRPVAQPGDAPRFIRELSSQTTKEGDEINLQCQAVGYPVPKLNWYKDGEPIDNNLDYMTTEMAGSGCLKVRRSRVALHEGTYICKATNNLGEASTTCHVTVQPGSPPSIIRPLHTTALRVGDRCKLTVQYKSSLPVEIDWYHRGQPIHSEPGRRRITTEGQDLANLNLPQITPDDQGEYKCVIRNVIGEATTLCYLTVNPREDMQPAPTPLNELMQTREHGLTEHPTALRRRYDVGPGSDEVFEPSKAPRLSEPFTARDGLIIQEATKRERIWTYTEQPRTLESRRATSVPPREFTMFIRKRPLVASPCQSTGMIQTPQFVRPLHNAEATEGQKIKLECTVIGFPPPQIKWLKNGLPLMRSNAYVTKEEGSKHSLVFYDIFLEDKGEYTCVAQNPYGEASTSCRMDVEPVSSGEEAERPPEVIRPLPRQLSVQEGGEVRLECVFSGRPVPTVVWLKDGKQPVTSEEFQPTQEGGVARLYMPHVRPERTGVYQAVATNTVGTCRSTLYLQIVPQPVPVMPSLSRPSTKPIPRGEGPDFTRIFKDIYIESERLEEIVLECTVTGFPPPSVYWTHNGRLITGEDNRYVPVQGPGPNDHCLIIRHPDATAAGRYQAVAENIHGRVTCSASVNPSAYSPGLSSRPPSLWSLNRVTTRHHIQTREYSMPPSPATTVSLISPISVARAQPPLSPIRLQRETSAPPPQQYMTRHHLQLTPRQATPPVQVTFPLPRKERSLSRSEITRTLESQLPSKGVVRHYSSTQFLNRMHVTPMVPQVSSTLTRRVASQPRLSPGYSSEEEHEHQMPVVPMVKHYRTRMERTLVARPRLRPGYRTEAEIRQQMSVTPMTPEYRTRIDHKVTSVPKLEPGYATETQRNIQMDVVPLVPEYMTQMHTELPSRPMLRRGFASEHEYLNRMEVTPVVPEYATQVRREVAGHPVLREGYSVENIHEHPMNVQPLVPEYRTEMATEITSRPDLQPGYFTEKVVPRPIEVTPLTVEYKTVVERPIATQPILEAGYSSEEEYSKQMQVIPLVPETKYHTEVATEIKARPKTAPAYSVEAEHARPMEVTPMVPEYKTELESKVASHPPLVAGHVSEQEHELQMDVVPVVPEYKTELSTDVISRPELTSGHETRLDYERALEVEAHRAEYITELATEVTAKPELQPGHVSATEHVRQMEVTPVVPEYRTELESKVVSHPSLEAGHVSEREHELPMDVVPVVPEYGTELSTDVISRPELMLGHETTTEFRRTFEWETQLKQYQSSLRAHVPSRPSLTSIFSSTVQHETSMNIVPVVPHEERFLSLLNQEILLEYQPIDLTIEVPIPPQFVKPLSSIMAAEGTRVVLDGIVTGKPEPTISWFKAGRQISQGPDFQLHYEDGCVTLTLPEAFTDDSGEYTCAAENVAGTAESTATIIIQACLLAPRFTKGLENQMIKEGQSVKLVVKVEGHPPPTVVWTCNGREITSSGHYILEVTGDGTHVLNIPDARFADTGRYTVIAKNPAGESVSTGLLTMQEIQHVKPVGEQHYRELTVQVEGLKQTPIESPAPPPPQPERPYFTQVYPPELELLEGERLVLTVEAWGNPLPFIHWLHNGKPLEDKPECHLSQMGPPLQQPDELQDQAVLMTGQLIINEVFPDDSGLYTCVAVNKYGQAEVLGNINISPKPSPPEPKQPPVQLPTMEEPKFISVPPPQILAKMNELVTLEAEAKGNPMPEISLYHNGQLLGTDKNHLVEIMPGTGKIHLQIDHFQPSDEGEWTVVATNVLGSVSSTTFILPIPEEPEKPKRTELEFQISHPTETLPVVSRETVIVTKPILMRPMFVERLPQKVETQETVPLTLSAKFKGQPTPSVKWLWNNKLLEENERIQYSFNGLDTVTLSLPHPAREDTGVYTCLIENEAGQDSCSVSINVAPATQPVPAATMSPPRFLRGPLPWPPTEMGDLIACPGQLLLQEGKPASLEVDVIGQPMPAVAWFNGSQPISPDNLHKTFVRQKGTYVLLINCPSTERDSGQYSCVATNNVGQAILQFSVQVQPKALPAQPPRFIEKPPTQITAIPDKPLVLRARVEGIPKPVLSWHKDGRVVPTVQDGRVSVQFNDYETTVTIAAASHEDLGQWQCLAANTAGTASARTTLKMPPETISDVLSREVQPEAKEKPMRAPRFVQFLQPVTAVEASEVSLFVQFDGEPAPQVTWMREDVNLETVADYKITSSETTSQLIIPKVFPEDGGVYSVILHNPVGQACSKSRLLVEVSVPEQLGRPPKFQQPFVQPVTVKVGEPVTFESKVLGEPLPQVHWEHNGIRLSTTELQHVRMFDAPPFHTLVILETQPEDAGEYRCVAVNPLGQDVNTAKVVIEEVPKPMEAVAPTILTGPKDLTVKESQPATFIARLKGIPLPEVTWLANGEVIKPSSYFQPQLLPNGEARLTITSAYQEDAGQYSIRAVNEAGEATATAHLAVEGPVPQNTAPRFVVPLPQGPVEVEEGKPLQLEVEVEGVPKPEITWLRNGQPFTTTPDWKLITEEYHSRLECREVFQSDSAEWTVQAKNSAGHVRTQTQVTVVPVVPAPEIQESSPPVFLKRVQSHLKVPFHHTAMLECAVSGTPEPALRWFHNGVEFQPHLITAPQEEPSAKQELLVDRAKHSYTLYIRDLNAFDVGEIMVRAENELGVTMCTSVLELDIVEGQLVGPRFVRQLPERLEVRPGDTARLECEVESQPPVSFRWYMNGLQLDQTVKNCRILEDVNRTTLVIPKIEVNNLPTLVKIEAAAQTGTKIVSTSVIEMIASADQTDTFYEKPVEVVTRETPIRFTKQLPQVFVIDRERHKVTLEVEIEKPADMVAETSPKPVFSWYMNGIDLFLNPSRDQSERYHITQDSAWQSRLVINEPSEVDVGDVTCAVSRVSSTGEERVLSTCHIELPDKSPKSPQPQLAARTELLFVPQFSPGLPATIKPELGSSVVFDLTVRANPKSEVNWSVSSPVTAERCEIMPPTEVDEVTTKYRMILHEFRSEDRNTVIEAVAISELGQATTICQLEAPAEAPASKGSETINVEFAKALSPEIEVPLTESVALECAVQPTSVPVEFHWYVNGTEVNSDMPLFDIKSTEFTSTLEIEEMKEEFVGPVSVSVISSQGQLLSEGKLQIAREAETLHIESESVQPIPERPDMIPADEFRFKKPVTAEIRATEQSLILECQIESAQQPVQVHWELEGRDLSPSDKMEMVYLEDTGLSRLVVHQPIPSDSGKYSCVATQPKIEEQGVAPRSIISSASVTVEEHLAEEVVQPFEVVAREEVPSEVVEKAELLFIKPVIPELKTTAPQELQLE